MKDRAMQTVLPLHEATFGEYTFSTDPSRIDIEWAIEALLATYWGNHRTADMIRESFRHSLVCGLYKGNRQVGLTRIITDYATFAYLCDVYVDPSERGNKVGTWMVEQTLDLPAMPRLRRWVLFTQDAQDLYRKFGFENPAYPERVMEQLNT
jgi:GNAT superfamily N-acetyltransferase